MIAKHINSLHSLKKQTMGSTFLSLLYAFICTVDSHWLVRCETEEHGSHHWKLFLDSQGRIRLLLILKLLLLYVLFLAHCQSKIFLFLLKVVVESCRGIPGKRGENRINWSENTRFFFSFLSLHTIHCPWIFMVHDNVMAAYSNHPVCLSGRTFSRSTQIKT